MATVVEGVDRCLGLEVDIASPVDALKRMLQKRVDLVDIQLRIVLVINDPQSAAQGRDKLLEVAVKEMLKEIQAE